MQYVIHLLYQLLILLDMIWQHSFNQRIENQLSFSESKAIKLSWLIDRFSPKRLFEKWHLSNVSENKNE